MHLVQQFGFDGENGFETSYQVKSQDEVYKSFEGGPTLHDIRSVDREIGKPTDRIDILDSGLVCARCQSDLSKRFRADGENKIICWECAMDIRDSQGGGGMSKAPDPTKAVLSKSGLNHKSLCDYVINVATGCRHGCKFCYVPSTPNISTRSEMLEDKVGVKDGQQEWGNYLLYRDDLPERLSRLLEGKSSWKNSERGRGVVMFSSGTDCYQDKRTSYITRGCVAELLKYNKQVRILTRSPLVTLDKDLFSKYSDKVSVGSSIPCLNDDLVRAIETNAPPPSSRLEALKELKEAGATIYVSMSPTYPNQTYDDLFETMKVFNELNPDVIFHEPINPRGSNFKMTVEAARQSDKTELANALEHVQDKERWVEYSLNHLRWVEDIAKELGQNIHLWPDKGLVNEAARQGYDLDMIQKLKEWIEKPSSEIFN